MPERNAQEIAALIKDAFSNVTLGDGIGLREAQGLDDYADAQTCASYRANDEKTDWSRIPIDELNSSFGQYALLSPAQRKAVRAYLHFILEDESYAFSHPHIVRALNEYWTDQS